MQAHPHTHTKKVQYSWREKEGKQGGKKMRAKEQDIKEIIHNYLP